MSKYCLVRFVDDNIVYVVLSKSINYIDKNLVWAPYKKMGFYEAVPIQFSDDRAFLDSKMRSMKQNTAKIDQLVNNHNYPADDENSDYSVGKHLELQGVSTNSEISEEIGNTLSNDEIDHICNNSDDSVNDPDYCPENKFVIQDMNNNSDTSEEMDISVPNDQEPLEVIDCGEVIENTHFTEWGRSDILDDTDYTADIDYKQMNVSNSYSKSKKHFCMFCHTLQTKFARHLQNKHKTENLVNQFLALEPKSKLRAKLINVIRSKGDLMHNTCKTFNMNNNLIVVRRPTLNKERDATHFKPCGCCGGMYSKLSLASHYRRCEASKIKGSKDVMINSKRKSIFITTACSVMRNDVLPVLRDDEVTETILSDDLIIAFGNRMCQKYRSPHFQKMIRARLRCVAKLYLTIKKNNRNIDRFEQIFDPEYYDSVISGINKMCHLNEETGKYKSPNTAFSLGSYMKKITFYLLSECIKRKEKERQNDVKDFLQLLQEGLQHDIYKTVEENKLERKRKKVIELPSSDDINALRNFLNRRREIYMLRLKQEYSIQDWKELMSVILISLQLFNRRRAGELERVKIDDYSRYERLKDDDEMLENISAKEINQKKSYVRFLIRGKLSRGVPVMVNKDNFEGIEMILQLRRQTNISTQNPYLFGLPGKDRYKHLDATRLLNKYSMLCGAKKPHTLRGTELRKHLATKCGTMNLGNIELKDVADYLGHHEKIHLDHYRLPNATKDIVRMSNLLEYAQGSTNHLLNESSTGGSSMEYENIYSETIAKECTNPDFSEKSAPECQRQCNTKLSWSNEEKQCVEDSFKSYLENFDLPSLDFCHDIITSNEVLKRRSATQLKAFVANRIEKKKQSLNPKVSAKGERKRWGSIERNAALTLFQKEIENKKLPSLKQCEKTIKDNPVFTGRTPEMLKAFINNTLKKHK